MLYSFFNFTDRCNIEWIIELNQTQTLGNYNFLRSFINSSGVISTSLKIWRINERPKS